MPTYGNVNGTWRETAPFGNVNGTWREVVQSFGNVNGTWRETWKKTYENLNLVNRVDPSMGDTALTARVANDGSIYVGGSNGRIKKFNSSGVEQWSYIRHTYEVIDIQIGNDGNIYSISVSESDRSTANWEICVQSPSGSLLQSTYGTGGNYRTFDLGAFSRLYIGGNEAGLLNTYIGALVTAKSMSSLSTSWEQQYTSANAHQMRLVTNQNLPHVYLYTSATGEGIFMINANDGSLYKTRVGHYNDLWADLSIDKADNSLYYAVPYGVQKLDTNLDIVWEVSYPVAGDVPYRSNGVGSLSVGDDGGVIAVTQRDDNIYGYWATKYDKDGNFIYHTPIIEDAGFLAGVRTSHANGNIFVALDTNSMLYIYEQS